MEELPVEVCVFKLVRERDVCECETKLRVKELGVEVCVKELCVCVKALRVEVCVFKLVREKDVCDKVACERAVC